MPLLSQAGTMTMATLFPTCLVLSTTSTVAIDILPRCYTLKTSGVGLGLAKEEDG